MRRSSILSVVLVGATATALVLSAQLLRPQPAQAIPMFAKRTGASCGLCHTVFPGMTNYGMMVMMSNFSMLPYHGAQGTGLSSFVLAGSYLSNPDGDPTPPKFFLDNLGLLNGGYIGPHFTYYLEQHIVDGGFIGGTDQFWVAYNELFSGSGSLQVGKFHTPFPFMPAHRITISPYETTSFTVGGNDFNEDDSHWGVTLGRMQGTMMYSISALGDNNLIGPGAFQLFGNGNHGLDVNLMTMSDNPFNFGVGLISGFAPPASAGAGFDRFNRTALYAQYIPAQNTLMKLQELGKLQIDSDPFVSVVATNYHGDFVEAQYDLAHGNWGVLRWDDQNGPSPVFGATLDFIHQLTLNSKITVEGRALNSGTRFGLSLEWAGPWTHRNVLAQPVLGTMPGMAGMDMSGSAQLSALDVALSRGDAAAGQHLFQSHRCEACHGVGGSGGGIGPRLVGAAGSLRPGQFYDYIKHPRAPMPDFHLDDADIADLVAYVVSLTPGHTVAGDVVSSGGHMAGMSMPGMSMRGMAMGVPPPLYPPSQRALQSGAQGYFAGVEAGDPALGGRLYASSCGSCHGTVAQGASAPQLEDMPARFTPSYIAWSIRSHGRTAPALRLSDAQIADLTAFLETMSARPIGATAQSSTVGSESRPR